MDTVLILALLIIFAIMMRPTGMAALTANLQVDRFADQELRAWPVAAATHIYKGGRVGINASGYLVPFTPATLFVGIAYEEVDNTGSAGAKTCRAYTQGDFVLSIAAFAITDVGKPVYASTDNDLSLVPASGMQIGHAIGFQETGKAIVRISPQFTWNNGMIVGRCELDCETGQTPQDVTIIPALFNKTGLLVFAVCSVVTEVFGGASQDQGVVTIQDTDGNSLGLTLTPSDAGADAVNDIIQEGGASATGVNATTGNPGAVSPAGKGIKAVVTQATSGAGAAGKQKVVVVAIPM